MMHFPRFVSKQLSRFLPERKIFGWATPPFLPFYHTVSPNQMTHIRNYPFPSPKQFEQELDFYLKYFKPVSLNYLYDNPNTTEKIFHLSFDDGLKECVEVVAPVLQKKGIPATFFINSGFVDNKELFHRYKASLILNELQQNPHSQAETFLQKNGINRKNLLQSAFSQKDILDETAELLELDLDAFLQKEEPYMNTQQIIKLAEQGFSVGAHSHKHPEFWNITEKKQLKQVKKSMQWVLKNINPRIKAFAFPYTDNRVSANFIRKLKEQNICDITFGTAGLKFDEVNSHFQRYPAERKGDFKKNLETEFVYFQLRKIAGKTIVRH